jgi:S-DNA-T family DNA segregation ATPase FtsK/SpoIIIE
VPHLLAPVITDSQKAINSLKWAVSEMDRRYQLLEDLGKRNIEDYNEFIKDSKIVDTGYEPLPYVVLVIDELGDLMMLAKNEVEPIIVRLTQMARAVGIHLAIGTQRPDTNVVTGLIKANIPTRVAFTVASQVDSRVILDQAGAEKLLGQGDGLYASPDNIQPLRFQGCLVEENEVRKVVNFWHKQVEDNNYPKNLKEEVTEPPKEKIVVPGMPESSTGQDEDEEELYPRIRNYVVQKGIASTSMLQTGFGIGYPKARKIISQLEDEGVVGPANGSKPREVLVET